MQQKKLKSVTAAASRHHSSIRKLRSGPQNSVFRRPSAVSRRAETPTWPSPSRRPAAEIGARIAARIRGVGGRRRGAPGEETALHAGVPRTGGGAAPPGRGARAPPLARAPAPGEGEKRAAGKSSRSAAARREAKAVGTYDYDATVDSHGGL